MGLNASLPPLYRKTRRKRSCGCFLLNSSLKRISPQSGFPSTGISFPTLAVSSLVRLASLLHEALIPADDLQSCARWAPRVNADQLAFILRLLPKVLPLAGQTGDPRGGGDSVQRTAFCQGEGLRQMKTQKSPAGRIVRIMFGPPGRGRPRGAPEPPEGPVIRQTSARQRRCRGPGARGPVLLLSTLGTLNF